MSTTPEAKRLLAAFLTKFPSLDPQWSEEVRGAWMRCFADLQALCAPQPPAGEPAVVEAQRELLKRWLDFHTEPAGMTPDIIHNRAAFEAFQDAIEAKSKALIEDTRAALGGDRG